MLIKNRNIIFILLVLSFPYTHATPLESFSQAKKVLTKAYQNELSGQTTIYCNATINWQGKKGLPDLSAVGYKVRKQEIRANRIEWEHVMPAHHIAQNGNRQCWKDGGRKNCERNDDWFKKASSDLHNLYPAVGEVNGDRSNYQFSAWKGEPGMGFYGKCTMKIDFKNRQAEPPDSAKGVVSRSYLYMSDKYDIKLSKSQRRLYEAWNRQFRAEPAECKRHEIVSKLQGSKNKYIDNFCQSQ